MKRNYFTRSVKSTIAECLVANLETQELEVTKIVTPKVFNSKEQLLKHLKKEHDNEITNIVSVRDYAIHKELYGIPMEKFLEIADKLDKDQVEESEEA